MLADSEQGFTMIEVVVSAMLITLIAAATASALIASNKVGADEKLHAQADQVAQLDQERMRGMSTKQLNGLNQTRSVTLGGTTFQVTSTATFLNTSGTTSCGSSGSGAVAYFRIVSSVDWLKNGTPYWANNGRTPVTEESIITPPAGGTLLAQVQNELGFGVSGVTVQVSGPDSDSATTDSNGCTIFGGLETGDYTMTLTKSGYVDPDGNASPLTIPATVTSSGTAAPSTGNPVKMALPGQMNAVFTSSNGATLTNQQAEDLSYYGSGGTYSMTNYKTYTPSTVPASTVPASGTIALFPFTAGGSYTGNYSIWTGACRQEQPPAGIDQFTITTGQTTNATVQEPGLKVVANYGGSPVQPDHIKVTFQSSSGPSCTDNLSPTVAACVSGGTSTQGCASGTQMPTNGWLVSPGQPFASTATSGSTASGSGYTGKLSLCADYKPSGFFQSSHKIVVGNVTSTNFAGLTTVTLNIPSSGGTGTCANGLG